MNAHRETHRVLGMKTTIKIFIKFALLMLFCQNVIAATSKDIIDGFSEFLIERANSNLVAIFERRLKNNEKFQCYFPNTHEKIDHISLENLFASKSYWESGLEADLEVLIYRSLYLETRESLKFFNRTDVRELLNNNKAIEIMQLFEYEKGNDRYSIHAIDTSLTKPLRVEINGFSALGNSLKAVKEIDSKFFQTEICGDIDLQTKDYKDKFRLFADAAEELIVWIDHIQQYGSGLKLSEAGKQKLVCNQKSLNKAQCSTLEIDDKAIITDLFNLNFPVELNTAKATAKRISHAYQVLQQFVEKEKETIDEIGLLISTLQNEGFDKSSIKQIKEMLKLAKELTSEDALTDKQAVKAKRLVELDDDTTDAKMVRKQLMVDVMARTKPAVNVEDPEAKKAFELLREFIDGKSLQSYTDRALVSLELLEDSSAFNTSSFGRLRNSVMFFASIADASDKEGVKAILTAYTLPPVSYAEKRKQGAGVFVSAYLGISAADFDDQGSNEEASGSGMFAPVGLEWNYGTDDGGSWSIMLSPIDMGFPINLKLNGIEDEVELDELVAPSITFAYGFADYPLNLGIGYQRGRTLDDVEEAEEGFLLFLSFDMPLLQFF